MRLGSCFVPQRVSSPQRWSLRWTPHCLPLRLRRELPFPRESATHTHTHTETHKISMSHITNNPPSTSFCISHRISKHTGVNNSSKSKQFYIFYSTYCLATRCFLTVCGVCFRLAKPAQPRNRLSTKRVNQVVNHNLNTDQQFCM